MKAREAVDKYHALHTRYKELQGAHRFLQETCDALQHELERERSSKQREIDDATRPLIQENRRLAAKLQQIHNIVFGKSEENESNAQSKEECKQPFREYYLVMPPGFGGKLISFQNLSEGMKRDAILVGFVAAEDTVYIEQYNVHSEKELSEEERERLKQLVEKLPTERSCTVREFKQLAARVAEMPSHEAE